jgi:glycosyltransferase involved in cell wall biosynthesis
MCNALGIEDSVEFHGWIGDDAKTDELRKAGVFCLPSYDEGLPMGVLEAMSSGVPIVTTPVGGVPDVLTDEVSALLFEPGDVPGLRERLVRLLEDADLRVKLASRALSDSNRFRPPQIADAWIRLYRKLLPDGGRPGSP